MNRFLSLFSICFLFSQCGSIEPTIPETIVQELPELTQKESTTYLPIKINLGPYLAEAEKSLPKSFIGKEENCEGVSYSYKFNRNPIKFEGKGDYLYYEVDGKYALNLNYCPDCTYLFDNKGTCVIPRIYTSCGVGEPMRKVMVAYATKFKITPDFKFKTSTNLNKFETIDACEITVFNYDATGKLRKEVVDVLKDLENDIDKEMASIDIRSEIEEVWKTLSEPTSLGKYGYLSIHPKSISLSDIKFENKQAAIELSLTIQPAVTTYPPEFKPNKLPLLSEHKKAKGFDINLDIIAGYDSLSSILTSEIAGKKILIKKNEVIFKTVEIQSALNNKLNLKVGFDGKRKGTLYLVGTPVFDSIQQIISFPDLVFDLKTKNALLKSAKWMFNSKITDLMRTSATFDLKPHLIEMKKMVQKEMNREISKGIKLSGNIDSIDLQNIYPNHDKLILRVNSKGEINLSM
jgi:hypothetical protein